MKTFRVAVVLGILASLVIGVLSVVPFIVNAQTGAAPARTNSWLSTFTFGGNPGTEQILSAIYATPVPTNSVPAMTNQSGGYPGTYWSLQRGDDLPPLPFNPFLDIPYYEVSPSNHWYVYDDRGVDYEAVQAMAAMMAQSSGATNPVFAGCMTCTYDESGLLWIEVPTNSLDTPGYFNMALHNTVQNQTYDVLTALDMADLWATELVVTGAVGNITPLELPLNDRANLLVRARTSTLHTFYLITPPLSQSVLDGDMVTFYVETGGNPNLTFQWTLDGNAIPGATNNSYTVFVVRGSDAGQYACIISDGTTSLATATAQLDVESGTGDLNYMEIVSARQNYTFKSGVTYYLGSQIQFYGNTTIEAGAVIKPDWYFNAGLVIMGTLNCKGEPYYPAVITSVDDELVGKSLGFSAEDGPPQPRQTGVPYLELACNKSNSISNLRIAYADWGVTTPTAAHRLEVWDCQFLNCNYGIVNLVAGDSTNALHNVLFAGCTAALGAGTNAITIEAEQVTADVTNFCLAYTLPARMDLKNSFIWGSAPDAASLSSFHVVVNPDPTNFVTAGAGKYYLAASSPHHQSGSSGISSRLQSELKNKTTSAPMALPAFMEISGQITLSPQAHRYTNGAPDIGYYYDALDYTVAHLILKGGTLDMLPGTAVGFRFDTLPQTRISPRGYNLIETYIGMDLWENSTLNAQGMPDRPCVFTDVQQVQEQPVVPVAAGFVPDFWPQHDGDQPPSMNFRFARFYMGHAFYLGAPQSHIWSGISAYGYQWSWCSAMNFTLQDSILRGGQVDIGLPDNPNYFGWMDFDTLLGSGAIAWNNNLFDGVSVRLNPTYYWYNGVMNCDIQVTAHNNLFKNGGWFILAPVPATAGNWLFTDNLFDKVDFIQDPTLPFDFNHNAYWPKATNEFLWLYSSAQLPGRTNSVNEAGKVTLTAAPAYQSGPLGSHYLSTNTPLFGAGSQTPDAAGLYHYTTRLDQVKAGSEPGAHQINIGLHYVAVANGVPKDIDSDGIADVVEDGNGNGVVDANETSPDLASTDGVTNDAYNAVYDDVDLSGSGLVGRIKKALGINPLELRNPFYLTQVGCGAEPGLVKFQLPFSFDTLTNVAGFRLVRNGGPGPERQVFAKDPTNGFAVLYWNVVFDPPGFHLLQPEVQLLKFEFINDQQPVTTAVGLSVLFENRNVVQFNSFDANFDSSGASLTASTYPSADYTIEIVDTNYNHLITITGTATTGNINEFWNLTGDDTNNTPFTGSEFNALYIVTPPGETVPQTNVLHESGVALGFGEGDFTVAYSWAQMSGPGGALHRCIQKGGVDPLISTDTTSGLNPHPYYSTFNDFSTYWTPGNPGHVTPDSVTNGIHMSDLIGNLSTNQGASGNYTRNFYWYGHGTPGSIGGVPGVHVEASKVGMELGNYDEIRVPSGQEGSMYMTRNLTHPYSFVFLDCCSTAKATSWATAFGIEEAITYDQVASQPLKARAILGWTGVTATLINEQNCLDYQNTLGFFFGLWQNEIPLEECAKASSDFGWPGQQYDPFHLMDIKVPIGIPLDYYGKRTGYHGPGSFTKIYGYSRIKRVGIAQPR